METPEFKKIHDEISKDIKTEPEPETEPTIAESSMEKPEKPEFLVKEEKDFDFQKAIERRKAKKEIEKQQITNLETELKTEPEKKKWEFMVEEPKGAFVSESTEIPKKESWWKRLFG